MRHALPAEIDLGVAVPRPLFARRRLITAQEGPPVRGGFRGGGAMAGALAWVTPDEIAVEMNGGVCVVDSEQVSTVRPVE